MQLEKRVEKARKRVKEILNERGKDYGDFKKLSDFVMKFFKQNISKVDNFATSDSDYNAACVGLFMLGVKLARLENTPEHDDSLLDFFGYLELIESLNITYEDSKLVLYPNKESSMLHKALIEIVNKGESDGNN